MAEFDIGIDLGTYKTAVCVNGDEIILSEPSVVAINTKRQEIIAVGEKAYRMLGKSPEYIKVLPALENGVISDYYLAQIMISDVLKRVSQNFVVKPRVTICVPSTTTTVEIRALTDAAADSGARKVYLIHEPIAAALGANVDISKPKGRFIIDIGAGATDIAVLSLNGSVIARSFQVAGNHLDNELIKYVAKKHKLLIGPHTAKKLKETIGNVYNPTVDECMEIRGRCLKTGLPKKVTINAKEILPALSEIVDLIIAHIEEILNETPPELSGDILTEGIVMTGGGSLLGGLGDLIYKRSNIKVSIAPQPQNCVALGTGRAFKYVENLGEGFLSSSILI